MPMEVFIINPDYTGNLEQSPLSEHGFRRFISSLQAFRTSRKAPAIADQLLFAAILAQKPQECSKFDYQTSNRRRMTPILPIAPMKMGKKSLRANTACAYRTRVRFTQHWWRPQDGLASGV
jgi:hypothetical protein